MSTKKKWFLRIALALCGMFAAVWAYVLYPFWGIPFNASRHGAVPITPAWALECWVWEDDANTAESTRALLDDYKKNDIPVRTVLLDSPWSTRYNDFHVDEKRFPEPEKFFKGLQDEGYRVVLWMTSAVNSKSKDMEGQDDTAWFQEAADKGYLINHGKEMKWWKGKGGLVDYSNPDAMQWWRGMQKQVFDWGIDGWKLDGTDPYALQWFGSLPFFYVPTYSGWMSNRVYADHYYRDEYTHGLSRNPEFITLARSIDSPMPWSHPEGYAPLDAAPVTWVGDNQHCWDDQERGIERALYCILRSAKLGYNVIGSDVAGYHGKEPIPSEVYIRWAEFSSFCGLFLNGGHGERRMSLRTPDEREVVRKFSWLHTELVPYMYSLGVEAHETGRPLMRPLPEGDYHYMFGPDLLVAPIHQNETERTVHLPPGRWRYLFADAEVVEGPAAITREFPMTEYPVFVRDGAVIPMRISREYTGIGQRDWEPYLTFNIYPEGKNAFTVYEEKTRVNCKASVEKTDGKVTVTLEGGVKPHILRVFSENKPAHIECNGQPLVEEKDWRYDASGKRLVIRSEATDTRVYTVAY